MLEVNNKDTDVVLMFILNFEHISQLFSVSVVDFEHVLACWDSRWCHRVNNLMMGIYFYKNSYGQIDDMIYQLKLSGDTSRARFTFKLYPGPNLEK